VNDHHFGYITKSLKDLAISLQGGVFVGAVWFTLAQICGQIHHHLKALCKNSWTHMWLEVREVHQHFKIFIIVVSQVPLFFQGAFTPGVRDSCVEYPNTMLVI
jgi:hypothetical protein